MYGSSINKLGKMERNKKVKEGNCIFPFKYKHKTHTNCFPTEKGDICATSVNERQTLQTYGYCNKKKSTVKKEPSQKSNSKTLKIKKSNKKRKLKLKTNESELNTSIQNSNMKVYNDEFIELLGKLYTILMSQGEVFRARAYKKAQETIMSITEDIVNVSQLKGKKGIGETILKKLNEYVETGTLALLEREKNNPVAIFTTIYGVGPKKAKELVEKHNIKTVEELRENKNLLNDKQLIGLKYFEAINERIPRKEIDQYNKLFTKLFNEIKESTSTFEIVGSYRRKTQTSGDIDVIITDKENKKEIFDKFIDLLIEKGIIIEILSKGSIKSLVIAQLPDKTPRRVDFMYTTPDEYPFAILYFTGSAIFNTIMRQIALDAGFSMNEHGMYTMIERKKGSKVNHVFNTEKDIFDFLNMEYKEPHERTDSRAVVVKTNSNSKTSQEKKEKSIIIKVKNKKKRKTLKKIKIKTYSSKEHLETFALEGIDYLKQLSQDDLSKMLKDANDAYYNKEPLITDSQFDILKEYIEQEYPKNQVLQNIGAPIEKYEKNKVKLPYFMGSMDKIKPDTRALSQWMTSYKGPYVLSTKLDGISALYSTEEEKPKLFTRGNGVYGMDITHLLRYLKLPVINNTTIRGELIMSKTTFKNKYSDEWSNARNLVSGIVNAKTPVPDRYPDIDFVAYEVIQPVMKSSEQFNWLQTNYPKVALHEFTDIISNESLSRTLISWRESYEYEIDGVIATNDKIYSRRDGNPKHSVAFKMVLSDQIVEAKVIDVLWSPSKDGYLKPRIRIEPVTIGGAKIEYATAFNAGFVEEKKIGIGAIIQLIRSGDVIPHIMDVITPAPQAKMPNVPYKWNDTHVDIILINASQDENVKLKNITSFFVGLGVIGLSSGNIKRMMKASFDSVQKILQMRISDFLQVDGFKEKMANKLYFSIQEKIEEVTLSKLMVISNIFGRGMGEKRIESVLEFYPDILTSIESENDKIHKISQISGFAKKTAQLFVSNISKFITFINEIGLQEKLRPKTPEKKNSQHPLFKKSILMTGFRDKDLERKIKDVGGKIASAVSKNTFIVLVKDIHEETGKANKARELNVPLILPEDFITKFQL